MKHAPRGPVKARDPLQGDQPIQTSGLLGGSAPRCHAKSKRSGQPCKNPAILGATVCRMHGGSAPQVRQAARERLMALQPLAIQTLHNLMNRDEYPTVQLGAARDVLDRTEGKPHESVSVTGKDEGPLEIVIRKPWAESKNP